MNHRIRLSPAFFLVVAAVGIGGTVTWLLMQGPAKAVKPAAPAIPATVSNPLKEEEVNHIKLSAEAVARLAIRFGQVERKPMRQTRVYGGEITIPTGQAIIVSAPLSGLLKAPDGGITSPGQKVSKHQLIFQLLPLLTAEGRANLAASKIDADGQVKSAQTQLEAARIALDRAKQLLKNEAGSRRAVDEAQSQHDLAHKAVEASTARRDLLEKVVGEVEQGTSAPLAIPSPETGLLRNVSALAGQNVPAGAALFEVVDLKQVWVRVPVYVGDLPRIDAAAEAAIGALTAHPGAPVQLAKPATAPPSANPAAGTVDLFYLLDNREAKYGPGQRVGVTLKLAGEAESLAIPWSAVIYDIHGGTWVYEQADALLFVRRRVAVRFVDGDTAVLAAGPKSGTKVVIAGAAELFGAETGFSK
jgi:RND family efflux transporter MFP subunit